MDSLNIVTVVKNDRKSLELTIKSAFVLALNLPEVRFLHFIQDGGNSTHNHSFFLKALKKKNKSNYKIIHCKSLDAGIFDAMNKVTSKFKNGDLVLFLNAGDTFCENFNFKKFLYAIKNFKNRTETICFFRSKNVYKNTSYFMPPKSIRSTKSFQKWIMSNTPVHQSVIFKVCNKYQLKYSLDFQIQSDSFLIYTILKNYSKPIFYNFELCKFELGGLSGNYLNFKKTFLQIKEQIKIMKLRGQAFEAITLTFVLMITKFLLHNLFRKYFTFIHAKINRLIKN